MSDESFNSDSLFASRPSHFVPCVLFALSRESAGLRRLFPHTLPLAGAPYRARLCGSSRAPVLIVETGIGSERTRQALAWLFGKPTINNFPYEPQLLVFAGFAGSLVEDLRVGDVVVATEVVDLDGKRWPTTWPVRLPSVPGPSSWRRGPILSSPGLVSDPERKRHLGEKHSALAVDMESAAFARICSERGIPFGCLRAISDDVKTALAPRLVELLEGGQVSVGRVLVAILRQPSLLREFIRLGRATRLASHQLGKALAELMTLTVD